MAATTPFPHGAPQPWPAQGHNPQTNSYFQSQQQPLPSLPRQSHIPPQQPGNALEEGELSEGDSEDLYDPKVLANASHAPVHTKATQPSNNLDSRSGSVGDADGSSIYDPHDPHTTHDERVVPVTSNNLPGREQEPPPDDDWEPSYPDRERSGSYSPYLSPREVHRKVSVVKAMFRDTKGTCNEILNDGIQSKYIQLPTASNLLNRPNPQVYFYS